MLPAEVINHIGGTVQVNSPKISGQMLFTAYVLRKQNNKKIYQAEVQNLKAPHEIYIVSLDDVSAIS